MLQHPICVFRNIYVANDYQRILYVSRNDGNRKKTLVSKTVRPEGLALDPRPGAGYVIHLMGF